MPPVHRLGTALLTSILRLQNGVADDSPGFQILQPPPQELNYFGGVDSGYRSDRKMTNLNSESDNFKSEIHPTGTQTVLLGDASLDGSEHPRTVPREYSSRFLAPRYLKNLLKSSERSGHRTET